MLRALLESVLTPTLSDVLAPGRQSLILPKLAEPVEFELSYSPKRRRISLQVDVDGITCKAPTGTPSEFIVNLFQQKQDWLATTLSKFEQFETSRLDWQRGGEFLFLGDWFKLSLKSGPRFYQSFEPIEKTLTFTIPSKVKNWQQYVKSKFQAFLHEQAELIIRPRMARLIVQTDLTPSALEFKIYQRRWGCCYKTGLIRINPQLIGATESVIDCVLIHELCHLVHMDHSQDFWRLNHLHCGRCKENDEWLKQHAFALKN